MLPSKLRLKLPSRWNRNYPDFKINNRLFRILGKKVDEGTNPRVGFIISTKVGKAVIRNRTRRKLETLLLPLLKKSKAAWELIIIVYPNCATVTDEELNLNFNQAVSKIPFE